MHSQIIRIACAAFLCALATRTHGAAPPAGPWIDNVIFILSDDHRADFIGCHPDAPRFLETPALDRMWREGAHCANAFVTTSLCSPSRASILTGQYMHRHRVVDNQHPIPPGTRFFPQDLQRAGLETAFIGKWHMGEDRDDPQPGFDHWASFRGQGEYHNQQINIDGQHRQLEGYNSDLLTDLAVDWLKHGRDASRRFFLYLSYKAPHYPFEPAPRHRGRYAHQPIRYPETMGNTEENYLTQPRWVRERRYSIHGIDHMETGNFDHDPVPNFDDLYRNYCETIHSLDENIGRLLAFLSDTGLAPRTMVVYMGDNGFHLGEHGFYDKRDAYETSIRVPLLAWAPNHISPATQIDQMILNIDLAPTLLAALAAPASGDPHRFDGQSFLPLLQRKPIAWRDHFIYEYQWEWNFPATPTLFALRTAHQKYIYHHGIWDRDALYDLDSDPVERHNLAGLPTFAPTLTKLRDQLFQELERRGALDCPVRPPSGERLDQRKLAR